jgi:hypothetical protein
MPGIIMLNVIMLGVIKLGVIRMNAIMLSVVAPFQIAYNDKIVFTSGFGFLQ